ncbi:MAG: hypothetical protein JWM33_2158 [Caulobacteraceae bacterium]|nr:hypothetical protein [Caulobacteraceae bacterium]
MTLAQTDNAPRPIALGLGRGLKERCPNCGEGKLYFAYLKVNPTCSACGHDLSAYRADDGPAYFTILIVGHLVLAPILLLDFLIKASLWVVIPSVLIGLTVVVLLILPRIKGAFIGILWATRANHGDGVAP